MKTNIIEHLKDEIIKKDEALQSEIESNKVITAAYWELTNEADSLQKDISKLVDQNSILTDKIKDLEIINNEIISQHDLISNQNEKKKIRGLK
jgi:hypothetical protein